MFSQVTQIGAIYQIPPAIDSLQWCKILPADGENSTNASLAGGEVDFDRLLPTLFECFAVVFCGFLAGRCNLISTTDIKGLNDFTTYFALPPLIFLNLATINFGQVNWMFVLGVLLGKILVFLLVALVTASLQRPLNLSYAGIYGIFCTQGNDFGLAYPIVASLYGSKRPLYPGYMYLIAPTSLLFLNPLGFILMQAQKNMDSVDGAKKAENGFALTILRTVCNVAWNILRNPIVFVTLLGVIGNFVFQGHLPSVLFGILQILASAFSAAVLFLLGFSVARTSESNFSKKEGLLIPSVLLITKMLVSPLITRSSVSALCAGAPDMEDLADYGFLYGMVPTGPIVMLFAAEYGLRTEMMASTMVLCTGLFGPLVFILARMFSLKIRGIDEFASELRTTMLVLSVLGFISCLWIGVCQILGKKIKKHLYKITGYLIISQIVMSLGTLMWSVSESRSPWVLYLELSLISGGQLMCRTWTALLALTLLLQRVHPDNPLLRSVFWTRCIGFGFPLAIVIMILVVTGIGHCRPELDKELPLFIYGTTEAVGSIVVLLICLTVTCLCLVLYFRSKSQAAVKEKSEEVIQKDVEMAIENLKDIPNDDSLVMGAGIAIYKMTITDSNNVLPNDQYLKKNEDNQTKAVNHTMKRIETSLSETYLLPTTPSESESPVHHPIIETHLRHVILLILLCISMAVGLTISTWKLSTNVSSGLYVAMEFLDAVLNVGQGIFTFLVFITDSKYIIGPISKWIRKVRYGFYSLDKQGDSADILIEQQCKQFYTYHRDNCLKDLPRTVKKNEQVYSDCFTGGDFVDWLMKVGLANHRTVAENYGQRLFRGGALLGADGAIQFHDNTAYLYNLRKLT